jgi:signal transduction histidine kinase
MNVSRAGLATAQEIAGAHGGRISVRSSQLGQGTAFTVRLPLSQLNFAAIATRKK